MTDWELVQEYAKSHSEAAFAELVRRHLDWVSSVALRKVGQTQLAEEAAQSVFVLLAKKARSLRSGTILGGWLFRTTCFVASRALRAEQRQKKREHLASSMDSTTISPDATEAAWQQLAPHLDGAVAALSEGDRTAILLRFYEKKPMQEIGSRLGISEDAAKKRVGRAVEKIRTSLIQRGVTLGGGVLATVLAANTVQAASVTLAANVIGAVTASASASAVLPHLARETLRAWQWAKIKIAAGVGVGSATLILVAINAGGLFTRHADSRTTSVRQLSGQATTQASAQPDNAIAALESNKTPSSSKIGAVTGLVLDMKDHPVAEAKVWGGFSFGPWAQDITDASGEFALATNTHPAFVTITADGFAADQQQVNPTNTSTRLVFHLQPIYPLEVRLVDESGQGVEGGDGFLQEWWGRPGTLGQYLNLHTDAEGRLKWLSPPRGEFLLTFGGGKFRYARTNKMVADGKEHLIVLHPTESVIGRVTDAMTGTPVPAFKLTMGHAQPWVPSDPNPLWDLQSSEARDGSFRVTIEEEQTPYVQIEADGYETLQSELKVTNSVESVCTLQLTPKSASSAIRGTVLRPDGNPAVGVSVALCTIQAGVSIRGNAFDSRFRGNLRGPRTNDFRGTTDEQGVFSFNAEPGAHTVVAVGPAGIGQMRCFDFSKPLELHLQAWGRIEGQIRLRKGNNSARKVHWVHQGNLTRWMTVEYEEEAFSAVSDSHGRFVIEHVPPGDCRVSIAGAEGVPPIYSTPIHVNAGRTTQVQVGGVGRQVIGRLVAPPGIGIRSWSNQVSFAQLAVKWGDYHVPKELTANDIERWKLEFEDTEAGRAWFREQCSYRFTVNENGLFTVPEVLPGKYWLFINVGQGYLGSGSDAKPGNPADPQIASAAPEITVTEGSSELDLGEIKLYPTH